MIMENFPKACTKQVLYKKLNDLPEREVRTVINTIVSENRNLPIQKAKFKKVLYKNEVRLVMEFFGYLEPKVLKS